MFAPEINCRFLASELQIMEENLVIHRFKSEESK
jgi:hypothetical protein